jgi:hypothetical protein
MDREKLKELPIANLESVMQRGSSSHMQDFANSQPVRGLTPRLRASNARLRRMAIGHKIRETIARLGRNVRQREALVAPCAEAPTTHKTGGATAPMPTETAPTHDERAADVMDDDLDHHLTSDDDVEVDTLNHERMEHLRRLAQELAVPSP